MIIDFMKKNAEGAKNLRWVYTYIQSIVLDLKTISIKNKSIINKNYGKYNITLKCIFLIWITKNKNSPSKYIKICNKSSVNKYLG